jgi:hypothetical protein
MILLRR